MKAIIIDDEPLAIENLELLIKEYCQEVDVIATGNNILTGLKLLNQHQPDIIFLDIEMPDGTGLELQELIQDKNIHIVFTSAHEKYALQAFKADAIDYLLKPVDVDDLISSIERVKSKLEKNLTDSSHKIILKTSDSIHIIDTSSIIRCESEGSYTRFVIQNEEEVLVSKGLKYYEDKLSSNRFYRIHQSHLINLSHLKKIIKVDGYQAEMNDGSIIPISNRKKDEFLTTISKLN